MSERFGLDLIDEINNDSQTHQKLVRKIEDLTGRTTIAYTSNSAHIIGPIDSNDAPWIENVLRSVSFKEIDGKKTLDLIIDSPGGDPLGAERIVLSCRQYADFFRVIVVKSAMSAATLIAMGADEIVMTQTAELGPIDPQMILMEGGHRILRPAFAFVEAYTELITKTQEAIAGGKPPHPYVELLKKLDPTWIRMCIQARDIAKRLAREFLTKYMLNGKTATEIEKVVGKFIAAGEEISHGRTIRYDKAREYGLEKITVVGKDDPLSDLLWEAAFRFNNYVIQRKIAKYFLGSTGGINVQIS